MDDHWIVTIRHTYEDGGLTEVTEGGSGGWRHGPGSDIGRVVAASIEWGAIECLAHAVVQVAELGEEHLMMASWLDADAAMIAAEECFIESAQVLEELVAIHKGIRNA